MIKLFILDKFPTLIDGLSILLSESKELEITGSATTLKGAADFINDTNTNIIIYDPYYWDRWDDINNNISLELSKCFPKIALMALLGEECKFSYFKTKEAGARAILAKTDTASEIVMAIKAIMAGFTIISKKANSINQHLYFDPKLRITKSEQKVLKLLAEGFSRKEIASITGKTNSSVNYHYKNIGKKLGGNRFNEVLESSYKNKTI
jgi:DNA-binding NarL/FixJ family response regulator